MDEVALEIETDKTALPVMCPGHGTITKMLVKQGEPVKSGQALFKVTSFYFIYCPLYNYYKR